ncbi:MAG: Dihydrofolate synthase @ Folylpolyglutamate synthase, partial [uncultured Acetobacteraceae bacterium]
GENAQRSHHRAPARPPPEADRPQPRPDAPGAGGAGPPGAAVAAGGPRRRHQRQGLLLRLLARDGGSGRSARPRLHLAAPRALPRAHPLGRDARRGAGAGRRAGRGGGAQRRRGDHRLRDHHRRSVPAVQPRAGRPAGAGDRPRRPLRRDQRGGPAGGDGHHLRVHGPHGVPGRHA